MISTALWNIYNSILCELEKLSRTSNVVGDYAEDLVAKALNGELAKTSEKGYDVTIGDVRIQVKATRQNWPTLVGNTSDIHNDDYDKLVGVIFDKHGNIRKVVILTLEEVHELSYPRGDSSSVIPWKKLAENGKDITNMFNSIVI